MKFLWLIEVLFGFDNSSMTRATEFSSFHNTQHSHTYTCTHIMYTPWCAYLVEKLLRLFIAWLAVASSVRVVYAHCLWAITTKWFTIAGSANKRWIRLHIIVLGLPLCPARRVARCIMHWNHINHIATCTLRNCSNIEPEVKLSGLHFYPPPLSLWYYAAYELFEDYLARQLILEQMLSVCHVIAH